MYKKHADFLCIQEDIYTMEYDQLHCTMQPEHNRMDFDNVDFYNPMLMDSQNRLYTRVFYTLQTDRLHMQEDNNIWLYGIHQFGIMH